MDTYDALMQNLNALLGTLERDGLSLDEVAEKLGLAYTMLEGLTHKLTETEAKVEAVIAARGARMGSATGGLPAK